MRRTLFALVLFVLPLASGLVGSLATGAASRAWLDSLVQPLYMVPQEVFGPVWSALYVLLGGSAVLAFRVAWARRLPGWLISRMVCTYLTLLAVLAAWPHLFFGLHLLVPAAILIVFALILACTLGLGWARLSPAAGLLTLPLVGWLAFALYLNIAFAYWNR